MFRINIVIFFFNYVDYLSSLMA